jgi:hypothetical protein
MKLLRMIKKEAGQALPITLILLALGGLLIVPMLSFMTTNLKTNIQVENKTEGIYAADAGIQDALWKLGNGIEPFPEGVESYELQENGSPVLINDMTVMVERVPYGDDESLYTIKSTARLNGDIKAVIIAQAISGADYSWLFKHALNSLNDVNIQPGNVIYGGVMAGGEVTGDQSAVVTGNITQHADVKMPSVATLTNLYRSQVDSEEEAPDGWYSEDPDTAWTGNYNVSGGTPENPWEIPPLYCRGDMEITGSGYAELTGTLFIDGAFTMQHKGLTLDLNGQTLYATYYEDPCPATVNSSNCAVYFGPDTQLVGPGCIIGVGSLNFQPGQMQGMWILGADPNDNYTDVTPTAPANRLVMTKFKTNKNLKTGEDQLGSFQVKCYVADPDAEPHAHVKVAVYKADGTNGAPKTWIASVDATDNLTAAWNTIEIKPAVQLDENTYYWLAAISNQPVITVRSGLDVGLASRYLDSNFETFEFPYPEFNLSGLQDPGDKEYQLRGFTGGQEFIFLMSVKCTTYLHPGANFYGSIAGNTMVDLQPNCFVSLVGMPDDGLNFPGIIGTAPGPGHGGNSPPILYYDIQ